ncbi:MAG: hypothetical protein JKP95_01510 [Oceanicaulis sp.]|nr:hypothetical protein [Oceanicaulis sp.]
MTRQSNWLPIRAGEPFAITARLYSPQPDALNGAPGRCPRWNG